ncbi:bisanhydrobacterioruberin hydratase [Halocatena marina]|uniref:bisanhydrobacterioruberin hydratase n=1 Tax=Halocatena marina TaxID=2934937 RepID=UPI00200F194E|nr:bisanhydrobacterioruberin hydratase [Halocatena marina]
MADITFDRQRAEQAFDEFVRENRVLFAIVFPLVGAILLLASTESMLPPVLSFNPLLVLVGVVAMRLPLIAGLVTLVNRKAASALVILTAYAYSIEYIGVSTGVPYGSFSYSVGLGPLLFEKIPLGLPIFFLPLVVNSYLLCLLLFGERAERGLFRRSVAIITVVLMDLVLDPGAVGLGFWTYGGGQYYGVPLSNYFGWLVSATIAVTIFDWGFELADIRKRLQQCEFMLDTLVSFVILWGIVNIYFGNLVPVVLAGLLGLGLMKADRVDYTIRDVSPL